MQHMPLYRWEEVVAAIEERIRDGQLPVGARLPGERDLAREHGVAVVTARRAVAELRDRVCWPRWSDAERS